MSSAGILFLENTSFLSGFQRKQMRWSGFGGKAFPDETPAKTAVRETVEELFEVDLSENDIEQLIEQLSIWHEYSSKGYIFFVLPFSGITTISEFLEEKGYTSRVYPQFPKSITSLISQRIISNAKEIEKINLFTFSDIQEFQLAFDKHFLSDLRFFID